MTKINYRNIEKNIKSASNIFIMGHKDIDLDSFGSSLGLYCYASYNNKKCYIIIDDIKLELSSKKVIDMYQEKININKSSEILSLINKKSLLIIVDTNRKFLLQNPNLMEKFSNIIVVDHHDISDNSINISKNNKFIDTNISSTCELVTNMLKNDKFIVDSGIATVLLAGIVLDTNNFILKTNAATYYSAYYLSKYGADPKKVQYLLKQDIKEYIERQKVITEVKVIKNVAISKGLINKIYRREDLAKIADTILLFNNIEASFVIGKIDKNSVGISARSMGNIDVGEIMENFGGGGDNHEAASKIENQTLDVLTDEIIKLSKKI